MTQEEVRTAIQVAFLAVFNGVIPIALDNQPFSPPDPDGDDPNIKWARLTVMFINGSQDSLGRPGNRKFVRSGVLFIQCFTPKGTATSSNDVFCKQCADIFEGERIGVLWFKDTRIVTVGPDGSWYQQNVVADFEYELIK
jgi:hypothetical protein